MTGAVVYALSVDHSLTPPEDATPLPVLSRQLPRLVVHLLNGGGDRGLRFFPFIGREGRDRQFFVVEDLLPVTSLMRLHGQDPAPRFVLDGCIHGEGMRLRIVECEGGRARFDEDISFDVHDPLPLVSRMMFELTGLMGWSGALPTVPELDGRALVSFLVARDNLLSLEADLVSLDDVRLSSNALQTVELAPAEREVRDVALEIWSRQASSPSVNGNTAGIAGKVAQGCCSVNAAGLAPRPVAEFLTQAAAVLETCDQDALALAQYERAASLCPSQVDAVCRAATLYFETGRLQAARDILRRTLDAGERDTTVLAQLAVVEEHLGNEADHAELMEQLMEAPELEPPMVRIAVTYLIDRQREAEALALAEVFVARDPEAPGPWFDKGRALVAVGRPEEGINAFERCLGLDPTEVMRSEAERHLRFARSPELLQAMQDVDEALLEGQLRTALRRARRLVRDHAEVAEVWLFLGVTLQRLQRDRRAERALRRSIELEPRLGEAHNRLGILLVGRGDHREGYDELREAVRLEPREPSVHVHLAQACHHLGLHDEAVRALELAERLGGAAAAVEAVRRQFC